ncbi:MAG: hypothetical protein ABIU06_10870 [Anaerolineales bacterium]
MGNGYGNGRRVKSTINDTTTTYFVGNHYEVTGTGAVTKYYGVYPELVEVQVCALVAR